MPATAVVTQTCYPAYENDDEAALVALVAEVAGEPKVAAALDIPTQQSDQQTVGLSTWKDYCEVSVAYLARLPWRTVL